MIAIEMRNEWGRGERPDRFGLRDELVERCVGLAWGLVKGFILQKGINLSPKFSRHTPLSESGRRRRRA